MDFPVYFSTQYSLKDQPVNAPRIVNPLHKLRGERSKAEHIGKSAVFCGYCSLDLHHLIILRFFFSLLCNILKISLYFVLEKYKSQIIFLYVTVVLPDVVCKSLAFSFQLFFVFVCSVGVFLIHIFHSNQKTSRSPHFFFSRCLFPDIPILLIFNKF